MKNKKINKTKNIIIAVVCVVIAGIIVVGLYLNSSLATENTAANITDENFVETTCKDYISFDNKLTCKVSATIASNQEIASISLNLSDVPSEIDNLLDEKYESTILNEGKYVDIILGNNIITTDEPIKLELIDITLDNVTANGSTCAQSMFFINDKYAIIDGNIVFSCSLGTHYAPITYGFLQGPLKDANIIIDDKYLYLGNVKGMNLSQNNLNNLKEIVENALVLYGNPNLNGWSYKVSDDGSNVIITDYYGNNKNLKVIYIASFDSDYMLPWHATLNLYTRGNASLETLSNNLIKTNGYMLLKDNAIEIYADSEYKYLVDSRNWYYIKSDHYNFVNNVVNINGKVTYDEFMNNIEFHGITGVLYDSKGNKITGGYLDKTNKLTISGIPGWMTEDITINTEISDYIKINNANVFEISENNYIMYNIPSNLTPEEFLANIDTSGIIKLYDENDRLLNNYGGFISTNMYVEVTLSDKTLHYDLSVLGDVVGKGTVYLSDVVKLYKIHRGKIEPTQAETFAGDVVKDGNIDLLDVAKLYRYYRGVEESLK